MAPLQNNLCSTLDISSQQETTMRLRFNIAFVAMVAWPSVVLGLIPSDNPQSGSLPYSFYSGVQRKTSSSSNIDSEPATPESSDLSTRRTVLATFASASFVMASLTPALALAVDKPQEFVNVGTQAPAPDGENPFVTLANGVKIKEFRIGSGGDVVTPRSNVSIQCSGRLLNLNGVIFYNTKNNNPDGFGAIPLMMDLGKGQAVPGLEAGLMGMKKGGIRRIIVPQELAYNQFPDLEPKPMNANDQRALDSVVKNSQRDGAILFDVQVERVKQ
jgi:hypothetical protein